MLGQWVAHSRTPSGALLRLPGLPLAPLPKSILHPFNAASDGILAVHTTVSLQSHSRSMSFGLHNTTILTVRQPIVRVLET